MSPSATEIFLAARPRLFGLAYRMLSSAAEAEDIVQETWLRWQAVDHSTIADPRAFLATITVRLSLTLAQSARARRETYIGPWLPEPVDTRSDPHLGAERSQALSLAVLTLLQNLSPVERAAYILREAFDYSYDAIASLLSVSLANARQIVSRARRHLAESPSAATSSAADSAVTATSIKAQQDTETQHRQHEHLLRTLVEAARHGDLASLERLFAADVVSTTDGNGVVNAARKPLTGSSRVAKLMGNTHFWREVTFASIQANGQPAILLYRDGVLMAFGTLELENDRIRQIFWVMNPDKLTTIAKAAGPPAP
jgi:RNA polymerase sigma-70 factor, ECF subfamily